ncbi:MAG TPA: glycine oxidase ThiO [Candidatus Polarisedimenticolia bacterium]|nr:glycine oxidase ThiO [Candidatus Polarisedimenticolia bacterium]
MTGESSSRVLVVGGGIIGCSVARELAGRGCRVTLLERDRVACEATSAAAGILSPQIEAEGPSPFLDLGLESLRLYPQFARELMEETGIDPQLDSRGILQVNLTREDEVSSGELLRWQKLAGLPVEELSAEEVTTLEPGLSATLLGGLYFPRGAQVDPVPLSRALALAARRRGAEIREGAAVLNFAKRDGRVVGVEMEGGEFLEAEQVVLAAGAWSSALLPGVEARVFPVRGQIVVLDSRRPPRGHPIYTPRGYLVHRRDGRVLVGSTNERVGFRKAVTPRSLIRLVAIALALDPALEDSTLATAWSGLRPGTEDGKPLLGEVRPGLLAATGHYRGGILLAPVTAALIAEMVLSGTTSSDLAPFSPLRSVRSGHAEVVP